MVVLISALLAAGAPISIAQMRGPGLSGARASSGFGHGVGIPFNGRSHSHSFGRGAIFFGDPFYEDYPVAPLTMPPQFVVAQPPAAVEPPIETKSEPLMIELQGNRYVRFGGTQQSPERSTNSEPDYSEAKAGDSPHLTERRTKPELPPTVLIFRDGHREEIPEYAIVGSTLYASGNYWQSGQWTKTIQLSALDIPATAQANHQAGVNFMLPSGPNEVVTRP